MASILKVDKLDPQSGTALEIGTSGDTITVPSGATLDISASTLTPSAATSKILVICHFNEHGYVNGASDARGTYRLNAKDGSGAYAELYLGSEILGGYSYDGGGQWIGDTHAVTWLHSPSSTNAITFKLTVLTMSGATQAWNNSPGYSHMTLMEIGA